MNQNHLFRLQRFSPELKKIEQRPSPRRFSCLTVYTFLYREIGEKGVLEVYRLVSRMEEKEDEAWEKGWNSILR